MSMEGIRSITTSERYNLAVKKSISTQRAFEELLDELGTERLDKVIQYGEARYQETDREFNLWMSYSDVYRKFIRLRTLTRHANNKQTLAELRQTYLEMASYALMAVQILDQDYKG